MAKYKLYNSPSFIGSITEWKPNIGVSLLPAASIIFIFSNNNKRQLVNFVIDLGVPTDLKIRLESASYCFRPMVFEARENLRRPYW